MPCSIAPVAARRAVVGVAALALLGPMGCWRPAPVDLPAPRIHVVEATPDETTPDAPDAQAAAADPPALNPDPDGLDPYAAVTATSPVTMVDDAGKPVAVINAKGVKLEVRKEDGDVRRKVYCATCAPAGEGWVRTQDIVATRAD